MNKFTKYQEALEAAMKKLPVGPDGEVYMTSIANDQKGTIEGRTGINTAGVAAMLLAQSTHRVATPAEIETWKAEQAFRKAAIEAAASKKDGNINLDFNEFLAKFAGVLATGKGEAVELPAQATATVSTSRMSGNPKSSTPAQ